MFVVATTRLVETDEMSRKKMLKPLILSLLRTWEDVVVRR
jgi:hypothetical protein